MAPRRSSRRSSNLPNVEEMANTTTATLSASSVRKSSRPATKRIRSFVPDSSEAEDDIVEPAQAGASNSSTRQLLKAVAIPPMKSSDAKPKREQDSSTGSPSFENSDYETPGTSISTTPALSVGHGAKITRKSGLSAAVTAGFGASSSRKRTRFMIEKLEEDENTDINADAQLAMQLQLEENELDPNNHISLDSSSDEEPLAKRRATTSKGKGKGDAVVEDAVIVGSDDDSLSLTLTTPTYTGKGKGKAPAAAHRNSSRSRSARARAKAAKNFVLDSDLDEDVDDEDEFKLDDDDDVADSALDDEDDAIGGKMDTGSDSDDIPLSKVSKRALAALNTEPTAAKKQRGKKNKRLTREEKMARLRRNARFAHIADKWERKRAMNRERAEESHPKLLTMWKELEEVLVLEVQQAEQPPSINRRLKPFQLEGLSWMTRQEKTAYRGGLLGDEMGMGKTIQAVSLIMSDWPQKEPTLVVVPPVALMQWSNEIGAYTDGKLKVLVYHGTNSKCKKMTVKDLRKYDVIMVSYNSLESLHRKETKGWTRGEDIIKEASPLHAITYHRLILDEAHSIKSRTTGVAKACFALKGTYKWCLSGTPVQNRIGEFFSLLRFLEVRPFADYFCRSCDCEQLHWTVDEDHMCKACNHGASEHISVFNQELLNPITGDDPELREDALTKLHMITARIMLRRMKRDHTNSMELPMKDIVIHNEFFSEVERDFSTSIMSNSARKFDTYVAQGVMLNNYANIFGLIMQMRQVANHPDLLLKKKAAEGSQNVYVCNICDEPAEDAVRSRCHHEFCRACVKDFMDTCEASGTDADCPRCHIALSIDFEQPELEQDEESVKKTSIINRIKMENWTSSTKIEMLVYDLYKLRSKKQTLKSIVFSQFTSMLQLIEWRLRRAGFNTVMLDGSMTPAQRQKSIEHFMTNPDVEVFLVSLKAGGVALNLTEASRVFIVDPWWNPAAEWQSADRCHRIGQKRPCVITRLCIEDSVESRMVALQEKKAAMIAGTVNNDKVAMDRLSPEDLQFLFRGS
ncbi:DNA repair protein rad16 [Didymosphaeria variabile]|uniref:DNA repair protein rad16 n=1 Tax=Didymosphaeria variabile TaxID=1932322 RepID=A0A9W9CAZ3_9PLEO|nr:DNA repair protein rad16 [Didymosphaeria variabile]KAJ4354231.1 DNA repair protein rad16 [Didymosphaeria variabile]